MSTRYKVAELEGRLLDEAVAKADADNYDGVVFHQQFSTDWGVAGPIIEREGICIAGNSASYSLDTLYHGAPVAHPNDPLFNGPTPLIAAMRAFVRSKLGDEVEL